MKLAVFYPQALGSAWCVAGGLVEELRRQGHDVYSIPCPGNRVPIVSIDTLREQDAVIVSGLEHLIGGITSQYKRLDWAQLKVLTWYHESFDRPDYTLDFDRFKDMADVHCFPAWQDAHRWGEFLPFAADTTIFKPMDIPKVYSALFIGTMYPLRQRFFNEVMDIDREIGKRIDKIRVEGATEYLSMVNYAEAINKAEVFVNLPTLSNLNVTKIFEVLACRVPLITEHKGEAIFVNHNHLIKYSNAAELCGWLVELWQYPELADTVAELGYREVMAYHTLEIRVKELVKLIS